MDTQGKWKGWKSIRWVEMGMVKAVRGERDGRRWESGKVNDGSFAR